MHVALQDTTPFWIVQSSPFPQAYPVISIFSRTNQIYFSPSLSLSSRYFQIGIARLVSRL